MLEIDSPFMLPDWGNTPSNWYIIAREVALTRGVSVLQVTEVCEKNLQQLVCNSLPNSFA